MMKSRRSCALAALWKHDGRDGSHKHGPRESFLSSQVVRAVSTFPSHRIYTGPSFHLVLWLSCCRFQHATILSLQLCHWRGTVCLLLRHTVVLRFVCSYSTSLPVRCNILADKMGHSEAPEARSLRCSLDHCLLQSSAIIHLYVVSDLKDCQLQAKKGQVLPQFF
jgi:hypothetical protein